MPQSSWTGYDLTTVVQNFEVLVERSIELLLDRGDADTVPEVVAAGSLRVGKTTRRSDA